MNEGDRRFHDDWFGVNGNPGMRSVVLDTRTRVHKIEKRQGITAWMARISLGLWGGVGVAALSGLVTWLLALV